MNKNQQTLLNTYASNYFQFQKQFPKRTSLLFADIKKVLECSEPVAEKFASTHCNLNSFWNCNISSGKTNMPYADFYDVMLEKQYCNKEGFIKVARDPDNSKEIICDEIFGYTFDALYYEDYEDVINPQARLDAGYFYQLKMKGDTSGFHFIACYIDIDTGIFMGADTSYRGTPFILSTKVNAKNFVWLLRI